MACGVYSRVSWKKISTLIKRLSGSNERERRAFEEPEQVKEKKTSYLSKEIDRIISGYSHGSLIYTYYSYMNKFHTEPLDWKNLFEYLEFDRLENEIEYKLKEKDK